MVGQRGSVAPTQGVPPPVDDVHPSSLEPGAGRSSGSISSTQEDESGREVVDFGNGGSDPPPEDKQITAPEASPGGPDTSAAMARNEKALCQQRLETLFPEVERAKGCCGSRCRGKKDHQRGSRPLTRKAKARNETTAGSVRSGASLGTRTRG